MVWRSPATATWRAASLNLRKARELFNTKPMTVDTPRPLGPPINTYDGLQKALCDRVEQLNVSRTVLDEVAGWPSGYSSKLFAPQPSKNLGSILLTLALQVLGVQMVLIEDPQFERIRPQLLPREVRVPVRAYKWGQEGRLVSKRWVKRIARLGGLAYREKVPPAKRRAHARRVALARWADIKKAARGA
jgi:hypothetical protein